MTETKMTPTGVSKVASKQDIIIKLLKRVKGASLADIGKATGWQEHSIRGFMSGRLKNRLKLNIESDKDSKGIRRYKIVDGVNRAHDDATTESAA